jgi:hypothetical protein
MAAKRVLSKEELANNLERVISEAEGVAEKLRAEIGGGDGEARIDEACSLLHIARRRAIELINDLQP